MSAPQGTASEARTTEGCRFCWMCRQACPVGYVTARETFTPHAWALVIESVARGQMTWNRETADVIYSCADCGLCQAHCATDRPLPDAIHATRVELASAGLAPGAAYALDEKLRADGGAFGKPAPARVVTSRSVLFVGDAAPHVSGASLASLLKLLAAAGIAAPAISQGRSSGLTASTLGFRDTAVSLARAVVADVVASGAKEVLVMSPGDRWTFAHVYPSRLGVEWPADVEVREVVTVLAEAVAAGRLNFRQSPEAPYAYHDPCHAPRVAETRPAPRALLAAALGDADARRFFFREHRAHPCGATGGLDVTSPAIASQLAASRLADAERAGASLVITEDPACLSQLSAAAGGRVAVKGLFEVLAARL